MAKVQLQNGSENVYPLIGNALGTWNTNISFPFVAPADGFIIFYANMSTNAGGYARVDLDNNSSLRAQCSSANGSGSGTCIPIKVGQTARLTSSGCSVSASFIPFT